MTDTLRDRWGGEKPTYTIGDQEPTVLQGIALPPRDEHFVRRHGGNGRPYVKDPTTGTETTYSRCTTFIKCIDQNEALERWQQRKAMEGFAMAADELQALVVSSQDNDSKMNGVWIRALDFGGAKMLAERGTAMHRVAEWYDLGQLPAVLPKAYEAGLQGWIAATRYFKMVQIEKFMVHDGLKVAGTPDRVVEYLPCAQCGRRLYILDLKTGRVDRYTELQIAMQLGTYANSVYYDVHTGGRILQDDICRCVAITVKVDIDSGAHIVYWTDIYTGWKVAEELAPQVHEARKLKGLLVPFEPEPSIPMLISSATLRDELRALHRAHAASWTDEHTKLASVRLLELDSPK